MSFETTSIVMYKTEDGATKIDVKFENETVWLTQLQMAELFQTTKQNISLHINNCFKEGELEEVRTVKEYLTVQNEGKRNVERSVKHYNLDVIISVGYRVKSLRGTQFRIWASAVLKEYMVKGFAMNDHVLKQAGGGTYFKELLERIRDIRSSEKVFYRQILDIYATSVDYDGKSQSTKLFFATIQNKMHYAAHNNTAAELVFNRTDAAKPLMGMNTKPTSSKALIAKNYLTENELAILNRLVSSYLDFAELQALRAIPMYMKDWIYKLDDFIKASGSELLLTAGKITAEEAKLKAKLEFEKYKEAAKDQLTEAELDYLASINELKKLDDKKRRGSN